ncbi:MAG: hypothetical protein DI527_23350, partial [Chelatococcus sp.]
IDAFDIDIDIRHAAVDRDAARTPRIPSDRDDPENPAAIASDRKVESTFRKTPMRRPVDS